MNDIKKIKYLRELEEQKNNLQRQIDLINQNIEDQRKSCLHLGVNLGYYAQYPSTMNKYRCLLCGAGRDDDFFYVSNSVDAEKYLPQYDVRNKSECDIKFDNVQKLAIEILKENPNITREELILKLNDLIQESISLSDIHKKTRRKD